METLPLLSTSIPAYFAFIPLIIIFVILVVLILKTNQSVPAVASSVATSPTAVPTMASASTVVPQTPMNPTISPLSEAVSVQTPPQAPASEGTLPPISSWKPAAQIAVPENVGQSESQMQAQAVIDAKATPVEMNPVENAPVHVPTPERVEVVTETVVTPSVPAEPTPTPTPTPEPAPAPEPTPEPVQAEVATETVETPSASEVVPTVDTPPAPEVVAVVEENLAQPAPEVTPVVEVEPAQAVAEAVPVTETQQETTPEPLPTEAIRV